MQMTDRDKKIIIILLIVAVVVLPYVLYSKDTRSDTESIKAETESLRARLAELEEMEQHREEWEQAVKDYHDKRDKIIASYPADIKPENLTMFLLNMERSSKKADDRFDDDFDYREYPFVFNSVAFGTNQVRQISAEGAEEVYEGITNSSNLSFTTYNYGLVGFDEDGNMVEQEINNSYATMKYILKYLKEYKDPMVYNAVSLQADSSTRSVTGSITLTQYAVSGEGRTLPNVVVDPDLDNIELRGNEDDGIFGKLLQEEEEELARTPIETGDEEGGEEGEAAEGEEGAEGEGAEGEGAEGGEENANN